MYEGNIFYYMLKYHPDSNHPSGYIAETQVGFKPCVRPSPDVPYCYYLSYQNQTNLALPKFYLGIEHAPPSYTLLNRTNPGLIGTYVISGKGTLNGQEFGAGDFYYTLPYECHTIIADEEEPWQSIWFTITGDNVEKVVTSLKKKSDQHFFFIPYPKDVYRFCDFLLYELGTMPDPVSFINALIQQLLSFIVSQNEMPDKNQSLGNLRKRAIIDIAIKSIEDNPQTITVQALAHQAHLESKYFSKIFSDITGLSPKQYIMKIKMMVAAHYLTHTNYSLDTITEILGYSHHNSLVTAFYNQFGINPSDYRSYNRTILPVSNEEQEQANLNNNELRNDTTIKKDNG